LRQRLPGLLQRFVVGLCMLACHSGCSRHGTARAPAADAALPFTIVATDGGYEAPDRVPAGLRHIVYENRGTQINEAMFVKLAPGMSADDYVAELRGGVLFPEGARDYSGPGLTAPGGRAELWLTLDPGNYVLICWFRDHAETLPVHPFTVDARRRDDPPPPTPDATVQLIDFRIELDRPLHAGPRRLRIETVGPSMHELDISGARCR
jgi:hypothetical protein